MTSYKFETLQIHSGHKPDQETHSRAVPIYQTSSYTFDSAEEAAALFALEQSGNIYTRINNPTTAVLEERVAALEGGSGALAVSSGHAAQFIALTTFLEVGDRFVSSPFLYGGSFNQFNVTLKKLGINVDFSKDLSPSSIEEKICENTKAIYIETLGNPGFNIPDFQKIALLAQKYQIPLIVDNTFGAGGYLCKPIEWGANVVVSSTTKWIGGHGTSIGGIIVDGGNFDWNNSKFSSFNRECNYSEKFGNKAFITKARVEGLRDFGACISPFNSFLILQGLETLSLRMERHISNTEALAQWFEKHPEIESVNYPGLSSHPENERAQKYLPKGAGGVLSIVLKGEKERGIALIDQLKLVSHLANVGDAKTLIIQPSATTHQQLDEKAQKSAGVYPTLLRISVGLEHIEDIIADFSQAFEIINSTKKEYLCPSV